MTNAPTVLVRTHGQKVPRKAHVDDAAFDLTAAEDMSFLPGNTKLVPTGLHIAIPEGYMGLVLPRSGMCLDSGLTVLNSPGLIDSGYRGEVGVVMHLTPSLADLLDIASSQPVELRTIRVVQGHRIAQLLIVRNTDATLALTTLDLPSAKSERGAGGFGSSGKE